MGIGDWVSSASDKVKQNVPDLTAVANIYRKTCKAIPVDGAEKMKEYLPGSEGWDKIKQVATEVAVPWILGYTGIPGAVQIWRITCGNLSSSSVHEPMPKELEKLKNRCEELKVEVEIMKLENKILIERYRRFKSQNEAFHQQPKEIQNAEEVIVDFLMNGFKGRDLLCHLIVPDAKAGYPKKALDGSYCHLLEQKMPVKSEY